MPELLAEYLKNDLNRESANNSGLRKSVPALSALTKVNLVRVSAPQISQTGAKSDLTEAEQNGGYEECRCQLRRLATETTIKGDLLRMIAMKQRPLLNTLAIRQQAVVRAVVRC